MVMKGKAWCLFLLGRTGANGLIVSQRDLVQNKGVSSLTARPMRRQDRLLGWAMGV